MRIFELFDYSNVVQLDIKVLVHALQGALYGDIILEFDGDLAVDKRLEEASFCQLALVQMRLPSNGCQTHLKNSIAALTLQTWNDVDLVWRPAALVIQ